MPSGPTVLDELANATFWFGVISDLSDRYDDITKAIDFGNAHLNFTNAARQGLSAHFNWLDGREGLASTIILEVLVPGAREALARRGIASEDIDRYLGVIEERVWSGQTGSRWLLSSLQAMKDQGTAGERMNALTAATVARQKSGEPVSRWEPAGVDEAGGWKHNYFQVEQYMTTDIYTVQEDEPIDLVANLMEWQKIRHVPVEDHEHRLTGLVSYRAVLRAFSHLPQSGPHPSVGDVMKRNPVTVTPETTTLEAIGLMREHQVGCLPVVQDGRLIGLVTEHDFMDIAAELLEQKLRE
jgi:CBS domain-containing protein